MNSSHPERKRIRKLHDKKKQVGKCQEKEGGAEARAESIVVFLRRWWVRDYGWMCTGGYL
jgi:hypothetical protein